MSVSGLVPGLFGKLPAHGDFVHRGWPEETVAALDDWLTAGVAAEREGRDDEAFAAAMSAAPMWQGYIPPDTLGPHALHLALAPSVDKAGRFFFLAGGVAGEAQAVWGQAIGSPGFGTALGRTMYDALATGLDADAMLDAVAGALAPPDPRMRLLAGAGAPQGGVWWIDDPAEGEPILLRRERADTRLIALLVAGEGVPA